MITHDIAEAVCLSDEIYVFSQRPATIKKKYNIGLSSQDSSVIKRRCPEFAEYYEQIWRDLDESI